MAWFDSLLKRHLKHRETSLAWTALGRLLLLASIVLNLPGCASFGPPSVDRDRFDYINAICEFLETANLAQYRQDALRRYAGVSGRGTNHQRLPVTGGRDGVGHAQ